eukprot:7559017-Lingulodinium_polyedra.AAC.1
MQELCDSRPIQCNNNALTMPCNANSKPITWQFNASANQGYNNAIQCQFNNAADMFRACCV